jgi:hypothetical protein
VSAHEVFVCIFLSENEFFRVVKLSVGACSDLVDVSRLEIYEYAARKLIALPDREKKVLNT